MGRIAIALILGTVLGVLVLSAVLFLPSAGNMDYTAMAPKDAVGFSKTFLEEIRTGKTDGIAAQLDPVTAAKVTPTLLAQLQAQFPAGAPSRTVLTGWKETFYKSLTGGATTDTTVLVLRDIYPNGKIVEADFTLVRTNGKLLVYGCHIQPAAPVQPVAFDLTKLSPTAYAYLALGLALDIFTMFTFVLCAMGPLPRWSTRWLWMIGIPFGLVRVNIALATGALSFLPLSIYLPPAGLLRPDAGAPWYLWLSVPVVAIIYWARRPHWRALNPKA